MTSSRQIASPNPLPSIVECSSRDRRKKGSKTRSSGFGGNTGSRVGDDHHQESASAFPVDANPSARWGVFHGVRDEIAKDLLAA